MIKEIHHACERLNETLGISVPLPNPGKNALKTASACQFAVGAGLAAAGLVFSSKWRAVLGGLSVVSGVILRQEGQTEE